MHLCIPQVTMAAPEGAGEIVAKALEEAAMEEDAIQAGCDYT